MENNRVYPFTRGAPLKNICALCAILKQAGRPLTEKELAALGKDDHLPSFQSVSSRSPLPTRVRHHLYAVRELKLVTVSERRYSLESRGQELADLILQQTDFPQILPILTHPIKKLLAKVMVESPYVRSAWLKYFMLKEDFTLQELLATSHIITIEVRGNNYWIHWQGGPSVVLSNIDRMEIYQGLRKWTNDIELTDEVILGDQRSNGEQKFHGTYGFSSRFVEVYVVRQHWNEAMPIELFEEKVRLLLDEVGSNGRIGIPDLIIALCRKERLSKRNVRELLERLYREKSSQYFFERASRQLLHLPSGVQPDNYYIRIDGIWRSGLVAVRAASR